MKQLIGLFISIALCQSVLAAEPILYKGEDITPLIEFYKPAVKVLSKPIKVFHYNKGGKNGDGAHLLSLAVRMGNSYWGSYGNEKGNENMMGYGFYAANDPIITASYGGSVDSYSLIQMTFPKGMRILDTIEFGQAKTSSEQILLANKLGCGLASPESIFSYGGLQISSTCRDLMKFIFRDHFRIQAFNYRYNQQGFGACSDRQSFSQISGPAYVITNSDWMTKKNVTFFTKDSTHEKEDRLIIQSLFVEAKFQLQLNNGSGGYTAPPLDPTQVLRNYLITNPDDDLVDYKNNCDENSCELVATFCNQQNVCKEVILIEKEKPKPPAPVYVQRVIKKADGVGFYGSGLLWNDLEGEQTYKELYEWLFQYRLGCYGTNPLVPMEDK